MAKHSLTQKQRLVKVISGVRFMTLYEIQQRIFDRFGVHDSETALSARYRELPNASKQKRRRENSCAYEYRVLG